jgi:biopolymer transport protein ExbD
MGASLGTDGKGSVNVELNIVPFIDLMSCLTAFLLVTAVWVNISQLDVKPQGKGRETPCDGDDCDKPKLSVLVDSDSVWIGVSRVNEFEQIPKTATGYDWDKVRDRLKVQKKSPFFDSKTHDRDRGQQHVGVTDPLQPADRRDGRRRAVGVPRRRPHRSERPVRTPDAVGHFL